MIYRTYEDLSDCIRRNIWKVPADVDLIVGVPRSGMIPAMMVAELLNKRCATLDDFVAGRVISCGDRERLMRSGMSNKVLVIDDTACLGHAMGIVRERTAPLRERYDILYASVYLDGADAKRIVDLYFEDLYTGEGIYMYEWNALHHYPRKTRMSMWDIDGLVCKEPPSDRNQSAYEQYLPDAVPMIIPATKVGAFVTYRLEKYREVTERWLQRQGIRYIQLIMFNAKTREERNRRQESADFKAQQYAAATWAQLFYESDARQAERIHQLTGKPVFCYENGRMYL